MNSGAKRRPRPVKAFAAVWTKPLPLLAYVSSCVMSLEVKTSSIGCETCIKWGLASRAILSPRESVSSKITAMPISPASLRQLTHVVRVLNALLIVLDGKIDIVLLYTSKNGTESGELVLQLTPANGRTFGISLKSALHSLAQATESIYHLAGPAHTELYGRSRMKVIQASMGFLAKGCFLVSIL